MVYSNEADEEWVRQIKEYVRGLQYGNVQIVVHDGRIVQLDITERKRFEPSTSANSPRNLSDHRK